MRKVARGVVFNQSGEVLVGLRSNYMGNAGFWEFPGGNIDDGDDYKKTVRKEFKEEVGAAVSWVGYRLYRTVARNLEISYYVTYLAKKEGNEPKLVEYDMLMWIKPEYLPSLNLSLGHDTKLIFSILRHKVRGTK